MVPVDRNTPVQSINNKGAPNIPYTAVLNTLLLYNNGHKCKVNFIPWVSGLYLILLQRSNWVKLQSQTQSAFGQVVFRKSWSIGTDYGTDYGKWQTAEAKISAGLQEKQKLQIRGFKSTRRSSFFTLLYLWPGVSETHLNMVELFKKVSTVN